MPGSERPGEDHFPGAVGIGALGLHVLVRLHAERAEALGIHVHAFGVFVLPIPDVDRAAFHLRHRLAMREVGFLVAHHEFNGGGIVRIFRGIGIFQEDGDVRPVVQGAHAQVPDRRFQNAVRPMDLRRHREGSRNRAGPDRRVRVIGRQGALHHRGANRNALLSCNRFRNEEPHGQQYTGNDARGDFTQSMLHKFRPLSTHVSEGGALCLPLASTEHLPSLRGARAQKA